MTNTIQIKRIITKLFRQVRCYSCAHMFQLDETRVHWRLRLHTSTKYLSAMFWTIHCESCFRETAQIWVNDLNSILINNGDIQ